MSQLLEMPTLHRWFGSLFLLVVLGVLIWGVYDTIRHRAARDKLREQRREKRRERAKASRRRR